MTLYETIFRRRSVRRYESAPMTAEALEEILAYVQAIPQLPGEKAAFRIITQREMGAGPAPYYIAASCTPGDSAYANVGYVLEQADLYLQARGLGSLWFGMKLPQESRAGDCIVLGFGPTEVPLRERESDFNRLSLEKIADADNEVTRAVRLAPSAVNSQPWQVRWEEDRVTVAYQGRGMMRLALEKKLNKIDVGIAARFAVTALEHRGAEIRDVRAVSAGRSLQMVISFADPGSPAPESGDKN